MCCEEVFRFSNAHLLLVAWASGPPRSSSIRHANHPLCVNAKHGSNDIPRLSALSCLTEFTTQMRTVLTKRTLVHSLAFSSKIRWLVDKAVTGLYDTYIFSGCICTMECLRSTSRRRHRPIPHAQLGQSTLWRGITFCAGPRFHRRIVFVAYTRGANAILPTVIYGIRKFVIFDDIPQSAANELSSFKPCVAESVGYAS